MTLSIIVLVIASRTREITVL